MKKVLTGIIIDGKAGGVDKYILEFFNAVADDNIEFDFLTNRIDEDLKKELSDKGAGLIQIPRFTKPLSQYKAVKALVRENKYDTVYFNVSSSLILFAAKAARDGGAKKVIIHAHSSAFDCENNLKRRLMTFLNNILKYPMCRYATDYCSCSQKASEWLFTPQVIKSGRVKLIYNAVDVEKFSFKPEIRERMRQEYGLENKYVIGHIGNFLYSKNHTFLIDAFKAVSQRDENAALLLLGDGALLDEIKSKTETLGLSLKVIFAGRQSNACDFLQAMDIFVLPSNFEGLPIVGIEAQVNRLPCLFSSNISSQARLLDCCEFIDISSPDAWADKILSYKGFYRGKAKIVNEEYCFDQNKLRETLKALI